MRVLIADDQRSFGTALADMVRFCGHEVVAIVGSGLEAIQAFTLHKPDLVLMDHWMPRLNGVTASRHILAKNPSAYVILVSAWAPLDGADESGAIRFLPKPVEFDRLKVALQAVADLISPPPVEIETSNESDQQHFPQLEIFSAAAEPFSTELAEAVPPAPEIIPFPMVSESSNEPSLDYFPRIPESSSFKQPALDVTLGVDRFPAEVLVAATMNGHEQNGTVSAVAKRKNGHKSRRRKKRAAER